MLVVLTVVAVINAPADWRGLKPIASSYMIVMATIVLFIVLPTVGIFFRGNFIWAPTYFSPGNLSASIWLVILALASFLYGYHVSRRRRQSPRDDRPEEPGGEEVQASSPPSSMPLIIVFIVVGVALKLYVIASVGGVSNAVVLLSSLGRTSAGVDPWNSLSSNLIMLRVVSGVADGAATWGLLTALRQRQHLAVWVFTVGGVLALTFLIIGKRLILLFPVFMILLGFHFYRRALTTKLLPVMVVGAVVFGLVTISVRALLPASLLGHEVDFSSSNYAQGSFLLYYLYSLEFAMLEMISVVMVSHEHIASMFGGTWDAFWATNVEPLFYTVPRALWPGKPSMFYDLSYGVSAELGGGSIDDPNGGYAPTLIGTSYLFVGVIGVAIALFVLGLLAARVDRRLERRQWSGRDIAIYALALVVVFHLFRQGSIGYALTISVVQQYGAIGAVLLLSVIEDRARTRDAQKAPALVT